MGEPLKFWRVIFTNGYYACWWCRSAEHVQERCKAEHPNKTIAEITLLE